MHKLITRASQATIKDALLLLFIIFNFRKMLKNGQVLINTDTCIQLINLRFLFFKVLTL